MLKLLFFFYIGFNIYINTHCFTDDDYASIIVNNDEFEPITEKSNTPQSPRSLYDLLRIQQGLLATEQDDKEADIKYEITSFKQLEFVIKTITKAINRINKSIRAINEYIDKINGDTGKATTEGSPTLSVRSKRESEPAKNETLAKIANTTETTGRRSMNVQTSNILKEKLMMYLGEAFVNIRNKLAPLDMVKNSLNANQFFKIGYITANLDTLTVHLDDMKQNMDMNKHTWDDKTVLTFFDKLKESDSAIDSLMGILQSQ